jgi:hypothetical protein
MRIGIADPRRMADESVNVSRRRSDNSPTPSRRGRRGGLHEIEIGPRTAAACHYQHRRLPLGHGDPRFLPRSIVEARKTAHVHRPPPYPPRRRGLLETLGIRSEQRNGAFVREQVGGIMAFAVLANDHNREAAQAGKHRHLDRYVDKN